MGPLEQTQAAQLTCVFIVPQASRVCSDIGKAKNNPMGSAPPTFDAYSNSLPPQREAGGWEFSPYCTMLNRGRTVVNKGHEFFYQL